MSISDRAGQRGAPSGTVEATPSVIAWALAESGMDAAELARRVGVSEGEIGSWIAAESRPRRNEFRRLAQAVGRPEAVFFLPSPPAESGIPQQFCSLGKPDPMLDRRLVLEIRRARRIQELISWIRKDAGQRPACSSSLPRLRVGEDIPTAAAELRRWLGLPAAAQDDPPGAPNEFRSLREALERSGVIVMQRRVGDEQIRGFAVADDRAPLIVVNLAEASHKRALTLIHELAHLASESVSVCVAPSVDPELRDIEEWCDLVAADVLSSYNAGEQLTTSGDLAPNGAAARRIHEFGAPVIQVLHHAEQRDRITLHDVFDHLELNSDEWDDLLSELKQPEHPLA